jgi:hypothetical protein
VALNEVFSETEGKGEQVFRNIINTYSENLENSSQALAAFGEDTKYIDLKSAEFENWSRSIDLTTKSAQQLKNELQEMNAIGKIESMDDWFVKKAEGLGLDEEDAEEMQIYAKHLMELAKESEDLPDTLARDADSAADLAVEITRMNKGV